MHCVPAEGPHCYHQRTPAEELPRGGTERAHELHPEHAQCNRRTMTADLRKNQRKEKAEKKINARRGAKANCKFQGAISIGIGGNRKERWQAIKVAFALSRALHMDCVEKH